MAKKKLASPSLWRPQKHRDDTTVLVERLVRGEQIHTIGAIVDDGKRQSRFMALQGSGEEKQTKP